MNHDVTTVNNLCFGVGKVYLVHYLVLNSSPLGTRIGRLDIS
jgi:hypothetical protein